MPVPDAPIGLLSILGFPNDYLMTTAFSYPHRRFGAMKYLLMCCTEE